MTITTSYQLLLHLGLEDLYLSTVVAEEDKVQEKDLIEKQKTETQYLMGHIGSKKYET